ncbi:hypothetical protein ACFVS2_20870 [Brevibacillus sp. NPDC058079]|uniref:hypothetical protein n=1 Tax=Brevibacillus sp. NPDC058079 TaxID=3346330 RepID=UPI0036E7C601
MIKLLINPHPNNYVVYCENEETLNEVVTKFESFLQEKHLRLFVKIGRVIPNKLSFEFKLTTNDEQERKDILSFLSSSEKATVTRYRVYVSDGYSSRYYPTNDLNLAIILAKSLDKETAVNIDVFLYEFSPDTTNPDLNDGYKLWKDKAGKTLEEIIISSKSGELEILNLVE